MNVSRQPFVVSALLGVALGAVCVVGRTGGAASQPAGAGTLGAMWALAVSAAAAVVAMAFVVQLAIRMAPGAGRNYLPIQVFIVAACAAGVPSAAGMMAAMFTAAAMRRAAMAAAPSRASGTKAGMKMESVLRAGLWFGLAALAYPPAAGLAAVMVPATLLIYKRGVREWIVALVGLGLPFGLAAFGWWALDRGSFAREFWTQIAAPSGWLTAIDRRTVLAAGAMAAAGVVAAMGGLAGRKSIRSAPRRFMTAAAALLAAGLATLAVPGCGAEILPLVGVGAAFSVPYGFTGRRWATASTAAWLAMLTAVGVGLLV